MNSPISSPSDPMTEADRTRYSRLMQTSAFRDGGFDRWYGTRLAVIGAGMLGARFCEEAVLSGANVVVFDPDVGQLSNLGNQTCRPEVFKVDSLRQRCDALRPGHLTAIPTDIRHADLRLLHRCQVWLDCSDDPNLAWILTELSNGLARCLVRCAVDGTGQTETGRVLVSGGGLGHACQCCGYAPKDVFQPLRRTPCPAQGTPEPHPTLAGGALAAGTAGLALSLVQRLITGQGADQIWSREFILDWTHFQLLPLTLPRSDHCLTGHQIWTPVELEFDVSAGTLADVFTAAETAVGSQEIDLEPYLHPWNLQATCPCGTVVHAVGTDVVSPPECPTCTGRMRWLAEMQVVRATRAQAESWGVLQRPLISLGIPSGAMFLARATGRPTRRLWLPSGATKKSLSDVPSPSVGAGSADPHPSHSNLGAEP
jgi:hypothetical protein